MAKQSGEGKKEKKVKRPTAEKRVLQSEKRRLRNKAFRSSIRTAVKRFDEALTEKDPENIKKELSAVYSIMDKAVKRSVYNSNKAARTKARFTVRASSMLAS